jgi:hypothetical protein
MPLHEEVSRLASHHGKAMVKKPDGAFVVVSHEELADLKAQKNIGLEYAKSREARLPM